MTQTVTKLIPLMTLLLALAVGWMPAAGADVLKVAKGAKSEQAEEERARAYFTDLPLLNHEGKEVRFYSDVLKDRVVLINFIYTNCKDACPLIIHRLLQVNDGLGDLLGKEVYFVSLSVDPVRDTPETLARYAKQQKADLPGWIFLTGEKKNIDAILRRLGQYNPKFEAHSTIFVAGNVKTRHWSKIIPTVPAHAIAMQLQNLASETMTKSRADASAGGAKKKKE